MYSSKICCIISFTLSGMKLQGLLTAVYWRGLIPLELESDLPEQPVCSVCSCRPRGSEFGGYIVALKHIIALKYMVALRYAATLRYVIASRSFVTIW